MVIFESYNLLLASNFLISKLNGESQFQTICIEDLHVRGMMRKRRLGRGISDMGFREIGRQLEYKARRKGAKLIMADRFFQVVNNVRIVGI